MLHERVHDSRSGMLQDDHAMLLLLLLMLLVCADAAPNSARASYANSASAYGSL